MGRDKRNGKTSADKPLKLAPPDFTMESALGGRVAGVDEVGRGPLAGPVMAAAAILDPVLMPPALLGRLADSKALNEAQRTEIALGLRAEAGRSIWFAVAAASVAEIERINILQATYLAMRRAVARLPVAPDHLLIDGNRLPPGMPCPGTAVVKGDARCLSIAAASILAKVLRDEGMKRLALRYPAYGWARNAGYPVPDHLSALRLFGVTRHHRKSFAPIRDLLAATPVEPKT
ncbi:ribonuclease HII [Lacibacterium aquatile]|uniref:Ribonuclease HII n=1 Tax=Lacibacterium aquatile TaxID=1168082 RepID=A0ABW5DLW4_9PROT